MRKLTETSYLWNQKYFYLFVYFWKYRKTEFNTESLEERHTQAICFLSEHMIENFSTLECEKNDNDNQKVPHCQERSKELNLLNYFDNFFVWCGRIFAKWRFKNSAWLLVFAWAYLIFTGFNGIIARAFVINVTVAINPAKNILNINMDENSNEILNEWIIGQGQICLIFWIFSESFSLSMI